MKRKILQIAKRANVSIVDYKSYKSDLGWQCFELVVIDGGTRYNFDYGYCYGGGENKLLDEFSNFLGEILNIEPSQRGYNWGEYASDIL